MRLKSLRTTTTRIRATNQRLKTTCVGNMLMLPLFLCCLLSSEVWSYANMKQQQQQHRLVRQLGAAKAVNYDKDSSMTNLYHQPHFTGNRAVIVQLFEWKFLDIAEECRNFLGPQGYAGVQISPTLEHTVIKTSSVNHPWWERYEVISYRLASRSGDESDFWSMSRICNDHGVRIYADVVLNHMAAPLNFLFDNVNGQNNKDFIVNTLLETNVNISQLNYSNVSYTQVDFHGSLCAVLSYTQDAHEIRNCQLNGHPDLDHSRAGVQKHIVGMLNKFIDMGVAGFRIDTAKYMWPIDLKNIFKQVKNLSTEFSFKKNSRPFVYHDVFDLGSDSVSKTEYSTYGVVSEYLYPAELATIIQRRVPLSSLINWGPALGFLAHEDALVFIDSHDTQRGLPQQLGNNQMLTYKERLKYIMANVFMLIHPYGAIKRIMSSYYFEDKDINQGPPAEDEDGEQIRSPEFNEQQQCTKDSGWVCEHRWPVLLSMIKVANYFNTPGQEEQSIIYFQTNGANQVAFCRGYKAFVAINNEPEIEFEKEVYACLEPGTYCDMVTGGKKEGEETCHGKMVVINEQGYTKLKLAVADAENDVDEEENEGEEGNEEESGRIESYGILVIYVESKIEPKGGDKANNKEKGVDDLQEQESNDQLPSEAEAKEGGEADENIEQPIEEVETSKEEGESDENNPEENEEDDAKEDGDDVEDTDAEVAGADSENAEGEGEDASEPNENNPEEKEEEDDDTKAEDDDVEDADAEVAGADNDNAEEEEAEGEDAGTSKGEEDENQSEENEEEDAKAEDADAEEQANDQEEGGAPEETNAKQVLKSEEEVEENVSEENGEGKEDSSENKEREEESKSEEKNEDEEAPKSEDSEKEEEGNDAKEIESKETANNDNEEGDAKSEEAITKEEENDEKLPLNDQPPEEKGEVENLDNSLEIITDETAIEEPVEEAETAESRNLEDKATETEQQMEKPIAEIVDESSSEAADMVTAKIQDVQAAGIFVKPKGDDNNG